MSGMGINNKIIIPPLKMYILKSVGAPFFLFGRDIYHSSPKWFQSFNGTAIENSLYLGKG